ncbi:disease resistance protein Pik-1 [Hibiscus syriacus]|uniref:disease resistance protein Pik-1 n=1 Tax=Hibiscus syriacus TaxID=106335 RepID=UPI001922ECC6|nr:disease resistance protein Pik-1 [Hibiscus syriacus]
MKQKIVLKVSMKCQKCRTEALKVSAKQEGVNFVGLEGNEKDKVVVIGEGFDAVKLTTDLRKKVGATEIISLAEQK